MATPTKSGNRTTMNTGYPAPTRLATPTDLKPEEIQAIVEAVNPLVADSFALYVKTKNFHWHLSGPHFRDYHLLFDEQAEAILASIDVMAERMRRIGGTTIRSLGHIQRLTQVHDDDEDAVSPQEMLRRLMEDNSAMARALRRAIAICDHSRDTVTANSLQDILDQAERRVWFLYENLQSA